MIGIGIGLAGAAMAVLGIVLKVKGSMSITIGGADGPTSVFVAGKLGNDSFTAAILVGIAFIAAAGLVLFGRKK